jgi:hypothetical protein
MEVGKEIIMKNNDINFYITLINKPSKLAKDNLNKAFQKIIKETVEENLKQEV